MSTTNNQDVGPPWAPPFAKVGRKVLDKYEQTKKAIYKLEQEIERQNKSLAYFKGQNDKQRYFELQPRLRQNEKDLADMRALAVVLQKKREEHQRIIFKLEEEAERLEFVMDQCRWDRSAGHQFKEAFKRHEEIMKEWKWRRAQLAPEAAKLEEEKEAAEMERASAEKEATERVTAEQKRQQELLRQKEEKERQFQSELAAQKKRNADAEAAAKKYQAELAAEQKRRAEVEVAAKKQAAADRDKYVQESIRRAEEEIQILKDSLAQREKFAKLLENEKATNRKQYEVYKAEEGKREQAVEEARQALADTKTRLFLEIEEKRNMTYEAWKVLERERQRVMDEASKRAAEKEKEACEARKEAERRASLAQEAKEVSFDSPRNQAYSHRPSPSYHQATPGSSRHQNNQPAADSRIVHHPQDVSRQDAFQPQNHFPTQLEPRYHQQSTHSPDLGVSSYAHEAPVGLSGMPVGLSGLPVGSSIASPSVPVASWDKYNWNEQEYPRSYRQQDYSHRIMSHQEPLPTATDHKRSSSAAHISPSEAPKEQWPLPPMPTPKPKQVDVRSPQETEEEKLRRELAEYKAKTAKLQADLERKKRVTGPDSVATWQTGTKSIWEDASKDASKNAPQSHHKETPKTQGEASSSRHNEQEGKRHSTKTNSTSRPSKPTVPVQNLRRREASAGPSNVRPSSRTSTPQTRHLEAKENVNKGRTPKGRVASSTTQSNWQKALSYLLPTPHRALSPPPKLPPTPPRGSRVSTPAAVRPAAPNEQVVFRKDTQTSKLTGLPGNWRSEQDLLAQLSSWPTNVSTPSVKSPAVPHVPTPSNGPKYVPPPASHCSYSTAIRQQQIPQPGYVYQPVPIYVAPQPVPSLNTVLDPLHAPETYVYIPKAVAAEAGPSGYGDGPLPPWADKTAAQSMESTQAPTRKDKGKEKAWP